MNRMYTSKARTMLHGGDYNPDQWLDMPGIIDEDFRLMKLSKCNAMSIGIFAWSALEPREGEYTFDWLDSIMDRLAAQNAYAVLATPSGARPAWMSQKYPEVLRVAPNRVRNLHGIRHNHCFSSPVYRSKVAAINSQLAKRYKDHPALLIWHLSNEYGGDCHCDLCQNAFREYLKARYHNDLDTLNRQWWTSFWSHAYSDWSQIESPAPHGEPLVHALNLDWHRFVTHQTVDFIKAEIAPLKAANPAIPVTTNLMGTYPELDYWKVKEVLDVVSWDSYPQWHRPDGDINEPSFQSFVHDMNRAFKNGKPFLLMESTPSTTNWMPVSRRKRPGMHLSSSLLAVAHGSDSVQYFQWRKSRGSCEKFHGAVVDHVGHEHTRVFNDVAAVGSALSLLDEIVGTSITPQIAMIYDWENFWALTDAKGVQGDKKYLSDCHYHYQALWKQGVPVDVINMDCDFSRYRLLIAPQLYMLRPGTAERITEFVKNGGTFVTTYMSGWVDQNDLCFLGGFPGPLRPVMGIWDEETDALFPTDSNALAISDSSAVGFDGTFALRDVCALIHAESAQVAATYTSDFYAGRPALTVNRFGTGQAWYLAARPQQEFLDKWYASLITRAGVQRNVEAHLPEGVTVQRRTDGVNDFVFVFNFLAQPQSIDLGPLPRYDMLEQAAASGTVTIAPYGTRIFKSAVQKG